jgi:hypothetical protein
MAPIAGEAFVLSWLLALFLGVFSWLIALATRDQWWQRFTKKSEESQLNPSPPKEFDLISTPPEIIRDLKKFLTEEVQDDNPQESSGQKQN